MLAYYIHIKLFLYRSVPLLRIKPSTHYRHIKVWFIRIFFLKKIYNFSILVVIYHTVQSVIMQVQFVCFLHSLKAI